MDTFVFTQACQMSFKYTVYIFYISLYLEMFTARCTPTESQSQLESDSKSEFKIESVYSSARCSTIHRPITGSSQVSGTCQIKHALYYTHVLDILYKK